MWLGFEPPDVDQMPSRRTVLATVAAAVAATTVGAFFLSESVRNRLLAGPYGASGYGEGVYGGLGSSGEGPMGDPRDR